MPESVVLGLSLLGGAGVSTAVLAAIFITALGFLTAFVVHLAGE